MTEKTIVNTGCSSGFGQMFVNESVPTDRMIELVAMNPGERPLRSVCGVDFGTAQFNESLEPFYGGVISAMGMEEFVKIKDSGKGVGDGSD